MSKSLKTYEDGSELTVGLLAAAAAVSVVMSLAAGAAAVKVSNWRTERWLRKNNLHQDQK